eukprot:235812-Chlamydomonas_euryale.AAC.1
MHPFSPRTSSGRRGARSSRVRWSSPWACRWACQLPQKAAASPATVRAVAADSAVRMSVCTMRSSARCCVCSASAAARSAGLPGAAAAALPPAPPDPPTPTPVSFASFDACSAAKLASRSAVHLRHAARRLSRAPRAAGCEPAGVPPRRRGEPQNRRPCLPEQRLLPPRPCLCTRLCRSLLHWPAD